jgi:PAS domain S-box-containing protein/putative nucleotidyltransferase with HDIG domain
MKRSDGEWRWLHSRDVPFARDESGVVTQILGSTDDVTERRAAAEELRESEARYRVLTESSQDLIFIIDRDDRVRYVNSAAAQILRRSAGDVVGESRAELFDAEVSAAMGVSLDRVFKSGETAHVESELIYPTGPAWVATMLVPIKDDDNVTAVFGVSRDITERKRAEDLAAQQAERIERTLTSVIDIAGDIVELRDPYTAGHQQRVSQLAVRMAESLGLSGHEIDDIRVAGLLHDMGKAGIPAEILSKPGVLSPIELTLIKGHAEAGYRLAVSANMAEPVAQMIYQHHERCDGSGYPLGLTGDQTLLGAKVLVVADVVEAMMSHRPYRPTLGTKAALAEIERGAGRLYDAEVSRVCVALFRESQFEFSA